MFIVIKRRLPKEIKNKLGMLFTTVCFVAKMKLAVNRFRKRKFIVREWIDLQKNNLSAIDIIKTKTKQLQFTANKTNIILQGLNQIQEQSHTIIDKLNNILTSKVIVFGKTIEKICTSFEAYGQYLKRYMERLMIIKQKDDQDANNKIWLNETSSKLMLQQNAQKIIYITYHISLLLAKYIKNISKTSKDMQEFTLAQQIINNLNKKYDKLISEEQKSKQIQRLQKMIGQKINHSFIYTEKCFWHSGEIKVHIFELLIVIEDNSSLTCLKLDKYCSIFIKYCQKLRLVCLVTKTNTVHFLFNFSKQLNKFVKVIQSYIKDQSFNTSLSVSQYPSLFDPFLSARIVDFRQTKNNRQEFMIVFSSLCVYTGEEDRIIQISNVVRESNLYWTELSAYNNQQQQSLNERVSLTISDLLKIKKTCQSQYGLKLQLPKMLNFDNKVGSNYLPILQWQEYLNTILRSKIIINNPILILKQLHVTDVFLEASLSKSNFSLENNKKQHCKLCQRVVITSLKRYFSQRLHFMFLKYKSRSKEYCYYIFQKIRQEICKISISKLNTCKQLIIWRQFRNGLIDYSFRKFVASQKYFFIEVGMLQIKQHSYEVQINQHSLVSQVIDQICLLMSVPVLVGYRLLVYIQEDEIILRANQLIFSIVDTYNINYQKSYSSTFLSKIKSFGRSLQMSERGILILKQIIYYPLTQAEQDQREYEQKQSAYLFKQQKLIGIPKDCIFQLIVLYSIKEFTNSKFKELPSSIPTKIYQKYTPNSLQEDVQENSQLIQRIYNSFKTLNKNQIDSLIQKKLSTSQLYKKHVLQMKVAEISENLSKSRRIKNVLVGIGWTGLVIFTLDQKIVTRFKWAQISLTLGILGLNISNEKQSIIVKCSQLYGIYQILLQYKALSQQIQMIRSR